MMQMTPVGLSNRVAFAAAQKPTFGNTQMEDQPAYVVDSFLEHPEPPPKLSSLLITFNTFLNGRHSRNIGRCSVEDAVGIKPKAFTALKRNGFVNEFTTEGEYYWGPMGMGGSEYGVISRTLSFTKKGTETLQRVVKHLDKDR